MTTLDRLEQQLAELEQQNTEAHRTGGATVWARANAARTAMAALARPLLAEARRLEALLIAQPAGPYQTFLPSDVGCRLTIDRELIDPREPKGSMTNPYVTEDLPFTVPESGVYWYGVADADGVAVTSARVTAGTTINRIGR